MLWTVKYIPSSSYCWHHPFWRAVDSGIVEFYWGSHRSRTGYVTACMNFYKSHICWAARRRTDDIRNPAQRWICTSGLGNPKCVLHGLRSWGGCAVGKERQHVGWWRLVTAVLRPKWLSLGKPDGCSLGMITVSIWFNSQWFCLRGIRELSSGVIGSVPDLIFGGTIFWEIHLAPVGQVPLLSNG